MDDATNVIRAALAEGRRSLSEHESLSVLDAREIPTVPREFIADHTDEGAVLQAARTIGFPVVLKGSGERMEHKTEQGLVRTGLEDESAVSQALATIRRAADNRLQGWLVQRHVSSIRELACGLVHDRSFGPTVMMGFGGIHAEVVGDTRFLVAPFTEREALGALDRLGTATILGPYRGSGPVDTEALARMLVALGDLGASQSGIAEVDINPVLFLQDGSPVAVDALVILDPMT